MKCKMKRFIIYGPSHKGRRSVMAYFLCFHETNRWIGYEYDWTTIGTYNSFDETYSGVKNFINDM